MRMLFLFFVVIVFTLWAAIFSRPGNRSLSNVLYAVSAVMAVLFIVGYLRLDGYL